MLLGECLVRGSCSKARTVVAWRVARYIGTSGCCTCLPSDRRNKTICALSSGCYVLPTPLTRTSMRKSHRSHKLARFPNLTAGGSRSYAPNGFAAFNFSARCRSRIEMNITEMRKPDRFLASFFFARRRILEFLSLDRSLTFEFEI